MEWAARYQLDPINITRSVLAFPSNVAYQKIVELNFFKNNTIRNLRAHLEKKWLHSSALILVLTKLYSRITERWNISIVTDSPLFIDPFLLFHSEKSEYVELHKQIIEYLMFLRDRAAEGRVSDGQLRNWYCFPEVKQNWLGFSETGNGGAGLGIDFAKNLHSNLHIIFSDWRRENH